LSDSLVDATHEKLEQFLSEPEICAVARQALEKGLSLEELPAAIDDIVKSAAGFERWSGQGESESLFGRWILAHAALRSLGRIAELPVVPEVRQLILRSYQTIAERAPARDALFRPRSREFREMAEIAVLRRFVAGQLHWKISGIPRSWPLQMKWREALKTVSAVCLMGGRAPCFEAHIPSRGSPLLIESEYMRCYVRMARSMELQPGIRGIFGSSWLHSEETMRVSPHLNWINQLFLDNGGLLVHMGPASPDSGFLIGSQKRRQLYDSGAYRPRNAMFIWPRTAVLNWVHRLPAAHSNPSH
jgi:hypothetical protein